MNEPRSSPLPDGLLLVLTTVASREEADRIAHALVEDGMAACVNVLAGCRSVYRWQGAVEQADELVMVMKTTRARYPAFEERLLAIHPYELPEIIALSPETVLPAYAAWVAAGTGAVQRDSRSQSAASSEK